MAVKIRLRRMGNTNTPFFRIVVADSRSPAKGRFLETLGWYDPMKKEGDDFKLDMERVTYWTSNGAQVTDTVNNLVKKARRMQPPKVEAAPVVEEAASAVEEAPAETEA